MTSAGAQHAIARRPLPIEATLYVRDDSDAANDPTHVMVDFASGDDKAHVCIAQRVTISFFLLDRHMGNEDTNSQD
ncbi:uncharacterized protein UDID_18724 [Ustilago sp. UG-2017a]|nr:uncharacterized protein UDID_18724 [Ustilago sp. UG-2017a]